MKKLNLPKIDKEIQLYWKDNNIFSKTIDDKDKPNFVFYEGPPSANGPPGIHHVLSRTIKDVFCRYKTMQGFYVYRKAGWDTHGLPVELGVEKSLKITKKDIGDKISVADYNNECKKDVMKFIDNWNDLTSKIGYWVDLENPYITYDSKYIESVWYLLKSLYNKDILYKGYTIQPYSPAAGTGLSSHELNQPGCYRDVTDISCVVQFKVIDPELGLAEHGEVFLLAWTTTPWTLPANTALCVNPDVKYVAINTINNYTKLPIVVILAKDLVQSYFKYENEYTILKEWFGKDLVGLKYEQLFGWVTVKDLNAFKVIADKFVTTNAGTGIVHIAPTFGEDDYRVAKENNVPPLLVIDKNGNKKPLVDESGKYFNIQDLDEDFVKEFVEDLDINFYGFKDFSGRYVKKEYDSNLKNDVNADLCSVLKHRNRLFKLEKYTHSYPHCWRTDKPIIYYPLDSWFIKTTSYKDRLVELNKTINWNPASTGSGRFGNWLENIQDWNLSRSRYWGIPLPIWRTEDGSEEKCIGSIEELYNEIEEAVKYGFMKENPYKDFVVGNFDKENYDKIDLHRHHVDEIILVSANGKPMKRELDVIDVWFDSGAMPYAQLHYPFENKEKIENEELYPADFIAEGVDQTRGWFFTLHALSVMLFDKPAFKNVISNGLVLDKNGNKMSKRLGNAIDPFDLLDKYGADVVRWYMASVSAGNNIKFDINSLEEIRNKFFGTLHNVYNFFETYAEIDKFIFNKDDIKFDSMSEIDKWILSLLNTLIRNVENSLDNYDSANAVSAINKFVLDDLSNWYVRLNRGRFWASGMEADKVSAYQTLYICLKTVTQLIAPIAPFYSEWLWRNLITRDSDESTCSVHLSQFPKLNHSLINKKLEEDMSLAQSISSMGLYLRHEAGIKVKQPLQSIVLPITDTLLKDSIKTVEKYILSELNVKEIVYVDDVKEFLIKKAKPNFKKLGAKCGKFTQLVARQILQLSENDINEIEKNNNLEINIDGMHVFNITINDIEIYHEAKKGWFSVAKDDLVVAMDTNLNEDLYREGLAREIVSVIQNCRKQLGFNVTDKIELTIYNPDKEIECVLFKHKNYILNSVLAQSLYMYNDYDIYRNDIQKHTIDNKYNLFLRIKICNNNHGPNYHHLF